MQEIESALAEHQFEHLFIECLGWDRFSTELRLECHGVAFPLRAIAQKRGVVVFLCESHRTVLANRYLLRRAQRQVSKAYHEHLLIHYSQTPLKQVWRWATTSLQNGRQLLVREHPFFSNRPPAKLLSRLQSLRIDLADEEQTTLIDVLAKVRAALQPQAELELFAKCPNLAAQSDGLAMAAKRGEPGALDRFIEFHMRLARKSSRMLVRWFGMDPDDAEQTAMIGLVLAAQRYDPELGTQFSTYASYWIRQICQRFGLEWGLPIRLPVYAFWPCYRLMFDQWRLMAEYGEPDWRIHFDILREQAGVAPDQWEGFCQARGMMLWTDASRSERSAMNQPDEDVTTHEVIANDLGEKIDAALGKLQTRQAHILRLRYGLGHRPHTLQEVGDRLGLTRERVRQIQAKAEAKLQQWLRGIEDDFALT